MISDGQPVAAETVRSDAADLYAPIHALGSTAISRTTQLTGMHFRAHRGRRQRTSHAPCGYVNGSFG
jgi:hypothetical protein